LIPATKRYPGFQSAGPLAPAVKLMQTRFR
jgi:hypothetical protein